MVEKAALSVSAFLTSSGCHEGILAELQKARYVMLTNEVDEPLGTLSRSCDSLIWPRVDGARFQ